MGNVTIPTALDPEGHEVPIEEAERFKTNYYRCPECNRILNPRKGSKRDHYYAHKAGVLEETDCALGTQSGVEQLVEDYRTSDVEKDERERNIRVLFHEVPGSHVELLGKLPTLEWGDFAPQADIKARFDEFSISATGVEDTPVPEDFHPRESEVLVALDPEADTYEITIDTGYQYDRIQGVWAAEGVAPGDIFVGDQTRSKRVTSNHKYRDGEWVYAVQRLPPAHPSDHVTTYSLDPFTVIRFQVTEETADLLEEHVGQTSTDEHGFNADILLPPDANPTTEAPIEAPKNTPALISVQPSSGVDPVFEVVSVPKRVGGKVEIEPTGPGNPRFYSTEFPEQGSRRISIHQSNTTRHRFVQLHTDEGTKREYNELGDSTSPVGVQVSLDETEYVLDPLRGPTRLIVGDDITPSTLKSATSLHGPDGLTIDITARFSEESTLGSRIERHETRLSDAIGELPHWMANGCTEVAFHFDGLGSVILILDSTTATDEDITVVGGSR